VDRRISYQLAARRVLLKNPLVRRGDTALVIQQFEQTFVDSRYILLLFQKELIKLFHFWSKYYFMSNLRSIVYLQILLRQQFTHHYPPKKTHFPQSLASILKPLAPPHPRVANFSSRNHSRDLLR
jgi:hypothetical protein